ncbi:MAG: hypothetical protein EXR76_09520 [Myxococcales bacterium]|nr:hypothetical protein [Myxococcales bacterium]
MSSESLARSFNETSAALEALGHRVVVRRARAFLETGDLSGAEAFLERVRQALPQAEVLGLASELSRFRESGGEVRVLMDEQGWKDGVAREAHFSRAVAAVTSTGLSGLTAGLAAVQAALVSGDGSDAGSGVEATDATADAEKPAIGNIFAASRRARAVVERPLGLESKSLDLEEPVTLEAELVETAPGPDAAVDLGFAQTMALEPITPSPLHAHSAHAPIVLPELHAPPEMVVAPANAAPSSQLGVATIIAIFLAMAALGAGLYLALK